MLKKPKIAGIGKVRLIQPDMEQQIMAVGQAKKNLPIGCLGFSVMA